MLYIVIVVSFTLVGPIVITHQIIGLKCQVFIGCKLYLINADPRIKIIKRQKMNILKPKPGVGAENIWSNEFFFFGVRKNGNKLLDICDSEKMKLMGI